MKTNFNNFSKKEKKIILELHNLKKIKNQLNEQWVKIEDPKTINVLNQRYITSKTNTLSQSYQSGQIVGRQVAKDVKQAIKMAVVTIGKISFKIILVGGAIIYLVGKGIWKINNSIGNALLKVLSATKKIIISTYQSIDDATTKVLQSAGQAIGVFFDKTVAETQKQIQSIKDTTTVFCKWLIGTMKQFESQVYAQVLIACNKIEGLSSKLGEWFSQQWQTVQNVIGTSWEKAKNIGTEVVNKISQTSSDIAQNVKQGAQGVMNTLATGAGNVSGFVKGMFEYFERINNFKSENIVELLQECMKYNNKTLITN